MIPFFNIPCDSPIEYQKASRRFPFDPKDEVLATKFTMAPASRRAKYSLDGRRLGEDGKPVEMLFPDQCWNQLIWRSQLLNQSSVTLLADKTTPFYGQNMEEQQKKEGIAFVQMLLDQFLSKLCPHRRHSSTFYINLCDEGIEEVTEFIRHGI